MTSSTTTNHKRQMPSPAGCFRFLALTLVMVAAGSAGCSSGPGARGADGGAGGAAGSGGVELFGAFAVTLHAAEPELGTPAYTTVGGKISDGPTPSEILWDEAAKDGACRLLTPRIPFCATPCGGSAICAADDLCVGRPTAQDVGTVTVAGLRQESGAGPLTLMSASNSYTLVDKPAYPPFDEGDDVSLAATGGAHPALEIHAKGIAPLVLTGDAPVLMTGQALELTWAAAGEGAASAIAIKLDISHHGGTTGVVTCDAPDTGKLTIAAPLITKLLALGYAGFPSVKVTRSSKGSSGHVDLTVEQTINWPVVIPGLQSCTDDAQCPAGQTCQPSSSCK